MKYGMHKHQYSELLRALSLVIYGRTVDHGDGVPVFEHFAENGFEVPCNVLTSVGTMHVVGTYPQIQIPHRHAFARGWTPTTSLNVAKNPAKSHVVDALVALSFLIDWDKKPFSDLNRDEKIGDKPPTLNITDHRRFNGPEQHAFAKYAFQCGIEQLTRAGLVRWQSSGGFRLIISSGGDPPIDFDDAKTMIAARYASG